ALGVSGIVEPPAASGEAADAGEADARSTVPPNACRSMSARRRDRRCCTRAGATAPTSDGSLRSHRIGLRVPNSWVPFRAASPLSPHDRVESRDPSVALARSDARATKVQYLSTRRV